MKTITQAQLNDWVELGHVQPAYKIKQGNKTYQYASGVVPGETDKLFRAEVNG